VSSCLTEVLPVNLPIRPLDRASLISSILVQRYPMQKRIDQTYQELKTLQNALMQAEDQRAQLLAQVELADVKDGLQDIDFRRTCATIEEELRALERLRQRFGRETLNIGVIGRARQGKSRLLQSLTGLTAQEIPDGDGEHCTGVKSSIIRRAGETSATVIFHNEQSFLEKISPYYKALDLGNAPQTLDHFAASPLAPLPASRSSADKEKHRHLKQYKDNLADYRHLIGQAPKAIKADEIRQYVAQDTQDGERIYSSYLVAKEVQIYCEFPNPDVGQISVIDMPGLGDTGIGDKERMIETLGESVDFVLFVKKPHNGNWEDSDIALYDTAKAALVDLPIKEWSFMVLNRTEDSRQGANHGYCEILQKTIEERNIHVSQTIIANCTKSNEVNDLILDPILNYMVKNIDRLDRKYAQDCQQRVNAICAEVKAILANANMVAPLLPSDDDGGRLFNARFNKFWPSLISSLRNMLKKLGRERKKQDPNFKHVIEKILTDCRKNPDLPSSERIQEVQDELRNWPGTQGQLMHETRNQLSKAFSGVEVGLKPCIDEVKQQIYQVLQQENLDRLEPEYKNAEYLQQVALNIPKDCPELKLAFEQLSSFELLYRGFIQHRLRKHLDVLTPDITSHRYDPDKWIWELTPPRKVKLTGKAQVERNLRNAYQEALDGCERELKALLDEPSSAAFAIAEEFVDRILLAENVRDEFWSFLWQYRKDIWPETFSQNEELRGVALSWKYTVKALEPFQDQNRYQFS
jgi:hypothetical protein